MNNNDSSNQIHQAVESLFSNLFYFDKKTPHVFYAKDITIHDPISTLSLQITQLLTQIVETSVEFAKQQQLEQLQSKQEVDKKEQLEPIQSSETAQTSEDQGSLLDDYYDFYYYNDIEF